MSDSRITATFETIHKVLDGLVAEVDSVDDARELTARMTRLAKFLAALRAKFMGHDELFISTAGFEITSAMFSSDSVEVFVAENNVEYGQLAVTLLVNAPADEEEDESIEILTRTLKQLQEDEDAIIAEEEEEANSDGFTEEEVEALQAPPPRRRAKKKVARKKE